MLAPPPPPEMPNDYLHSQEQPIQQPATLSYGQPPAMPGGQMAYGQPVYVAQPMALLMQAPPIDGAYLA